MSSAPKPPPPETVLLARVLRKLFQSRGEFSVRAWGKDFHVRASDDLLGRLVTRLLRKASRTPGPHGK